ncbi:MAG: hypothetical protein RIQ81_1902 [Pseudomonadota bacterium]|jgi:hypothetical protein
MKHKIFLITATAFFCSTILLGFGAQSQTGGDVRQINIATAGVPGIARIKAIVEGAGAESWWSEVGESMLVQASPAGFAQLTSAGFTATSVPGVEGIEDLRVFIGGHRDGSLDDLPGTTSVVVDAGRVKVIAGTSQTFATLESQANVDHAGSGLFHVEPNQVILRLASNDVVKESFSASQTTLIDDAAARVDRSRWWRDVQTLTAWNRHISASGNIAARDWIKSVFEAIPGMEVTLQDFRVQGRDAWNVVATLPANTKAIESARLGTSRSVVIGGHFDSISERPSSSAPGAEDNASGTAGVIELARVLADGPRAHDIVFVAFSGEEQGLHGSAAFVQALSPQQRQGILGAITMDMIAYASSGSQGSLGVLIETTRSFANFGRLFADAAARVTTLQVSTSYNPFGSDHMSFLDEGIPAILSIDKDWDDYGHYHRTTDTPDRLTPELAGEILKMNAAVAAALANQ